MCKSSIFEVNYYDYIEDLWKDSICYVYIYKEFDGRKDISVHFNAIWPMYQWMHAMSDNNILIPYKH